MTPLEPPLTDSALLSGFSVCTSPTCVYDPARAMRQRQPARLRSTVPVTASATLAAFPRVASGNWSLYEDRPGKPGWISTGPNGSTLEFDVSFSSSPRLAVVFDQSYEAYADARLSFEGVPGAYELRGVRPDSARVTQTAVVSMNVRQGVLQNFANGHGMAGFGIQPNARHTMRLTLLTAPSRQKFKLRYLACC